MEKERKYFEEVDAFELLEESPSPKNTWFAGNETDNIEVPQLTLRLQKWLVSKKLDFNCGQSSTLSKIFESPGMLHSEPVGGDNLNPIILGSSDESSQKSYSGLHSVHRRVNSFLLGKDVAGMLHSDNLNPIILDSSDESSQKSYSGLHSVHRRVNLFLLGKDVAERDSHAQKSSSMMASLRADNCIDIEDAVRKLSLASTYTSISQDYVDPFTSLLAVCGQSAPSTLLDVLSKYCDPKSIVKVGEGTYGEVFKIGNGVCKIVPIDGELRVNGEVQKRSEELLEEVVLSRTLNHLRANDGNMQNACTSFIETLDLRVCQGPYDHALVRAWEDWDEEHGSENDHPKGFPEKQCYVVFVLRHGGDDLESFVLLNFAEAQSLLCQVTAALAVSEAAYEFEHRDLHWGNILLYRSETPSVQFMLEGNKMVFSTSGILISIIDFTLSRINTGEDILYLDLSSDPYLFKGPKGDRQADTYRKMKEVTGDFWNGSFPRTNVLWLLYLVDILLLKKSFERSSKNERELRSLKKRLERCNSAKEAIADPFFRDLLVEQG
ncbi:hypothetical protein Tsubulata_046577, partial [Turnera subulata]